LLRPANAIAPLNLVYYQHSGSALSPFLASRADREAQLRNPRKDGGPTKNAPFDRFSAHWGAVDRAAVRRHGDLFGGAGARDACAARSGCALSGKIPTFADEASL